MTTFLWICCALALVPAVLVVWNLCLLRVPRASAARVGRVSVLIPARNEADNIAAAIESVLASAAADFELVVLDDHSSDATRDIVTGFVHRDSRVRLLEGRPLPPGFCGKPFACQQLADAARGDILVFLDADVRLAPTALHRLAGTLQASPAALLSGIPRQTTVTWSEKLIVPLMHFVLYGYLPIALMRSSTSPSLGAACGQLVAVKRTAYRESGGHAAIANRWHDGIALARRFRACGFLTDLVDATQIASCRMYVDARGVLEGFAKNAHEGLGSPRGLVPWTAILLLGQVAPIVALPWALASPASALPAIVAATLIVGTRIVLALRFDHARLGVLVHPLGVALLVAIQWYAALRRALRRPIAWKQRILTTDL